MGEQSKTRGIDSLREHVRILAGMLNDPEPGLVTWRQALYERIQAIKQFGLSPLDHAAPELLVEYKEHRMPANLYGTFPDALRNLATAIELRNLAGWSEWLREKAAALDAVIAKAEN